MTDYGRCLACGRPGATTRHHVLPRQVIRREGRSLGLRVRVLLADPRNLVPMHFDCHLAHENWAPRLTREQVPERAWQFARELGEWAVVRLERDYPVHDDDARPAAADGT